MDISLLDLAINAGGESRRMGRDKALLSVSANGPTLITYVAQRLSPLTEGPVYVVGHAATADFMAALPVGARHLPDHYSDAGALGGIATALRAVRGWLAMVACDMPLVTPAHFLQLQTYLSDEVDAIVPWVHGHWQPFCALYHRRCLPAIERRLARRELAISGFLDDVRVQQVSAHELLQVDPTLGSLVNVNTPDEWARVQPRLGMQSINKA